MNCSGPAENPVDRAIRGFKAKTADEKTLVTLIREHGLTREMIPTEHQKSVKVWDALLEKMPMWAMIRTLGRMGAVGLLAPFRTRIGEDRTDSRQTNRDNLRQARVHPIQVLSALLTYKQGHGQKGKLSWTPVPQVVDALNDAFYAAFEFDSSKRKAVLSRNRCFRLNGRRDRGWH